MYLYSNTFYNDAFIFKMWKQFISILKYLFGPVKYQEYLLPQIVFLFINYNNPSQLDRYNRTPVDNFN